VKALARWGRGSTAAVVAGIALAGCSSSGAVSPTPGSSPSAAPDTVQAAGFRFLPAQLTVALGTTLHYVNGDRSEHTISQGRDGTLDAGATFDTMLPIEGSVSVTFSRAGEIHVTCRIHPTMNQTVIVIGPAGPGGGATAPAASAPAASAPATNAPASARPSGAVPSGYGY
jgi:plastocyanin